MNGALIQLQKRSIQDSYLIQDPKITFFKTVVKRYTNFAIYNARQQFINPVKWGTNNFAEIAKLGDLVYKMYIVFELPEITGNSKGYIGRWTDSIGHSLLSQVSIELNSTQVDKHTGEFLEIWSQLTIPPGKTQGYREMIGQTDTLCGSYYYRRPATTIYVPLQFWFCRNSGLAFPIKAASRTTMKLLTSFRKFSEVWINTPDVDSIDNQFDDTSSFELNAYLLIDYIFLDTSESSRFTYGKQEYIIEQLQMSLNNSVSNTQDNNYTFQLTQLNNPVKCLFWVFQKESNVNNPENNSEAIGNQWTNFSAVSYNPRYTIFEANEQFKDFPNFYPTLEITNETVLSVDVLSYGNFSTLEPCVMRDCTLLFDSVERFPKSPGKYFNCIQTYEAFKNIPISKGIYVYSFALNSDTFEPCGAYTFSGLNDIRMNFTLNKTIQNNKCIWDKVLSGENLIDTYKRAKIAPQDSEPDIFNSYVYRNGGYYYESLDDTMTTYNLHVYAMNLQVLVISNGESGIKFNS